jgi:hypothetical protein
LAVWLQELTKYQQHEQKITSESTKSLRVLLFTKYKHILEAKPKDFDWADSDLYSDTGEGKADLPVMWSRQNLLEPAHMTETVLLK